MFIQRLIHTADKKNLIMKCVFNTIIALNLLIDLHHVSTTSISNCSNKRITCLSDVTYKFCFNTTSSNVVYGRIKRCPKFTVCREDKGNKPCINLENVTVNTIELPSITSIQYTSTPLPISIVLKTSKVICKDGGSPINKTTPTTQAYQVNLNETVAFKVETTKKPYIIGTKFKLTSITTADRHTFSPKLETTRKPLNGSAVSVPTKVKKKTHRPNKLKLKNKRKTNKLITNIIEYFKRFKKKSQSKKPGIVSKYPNNKKRTTTSPLKSNILSKKTTINAKYKRRTTKSPTKPFNSLRKSTITTKYAIHPNSSTTKSTIKKQVPKITRKPVKRPTNSKQHQVLTQKQNKKEPTIVIEPSQTNNSFSVIITSSTTSTETEYKLIDQTPTNSSSTNPTSTATVTSSITIPRSTTFSSPSTLSNLTSMTTVPTTSRISTKNTASTIEKFTSYYTVNTTPKKTLDITDTTESPPFPCDILEKIFKSYITLPTTISIVRTPPPSCKSPAKYPGEYCNKYYECMKVMWSYKLFTRKCKNGESFNAILSTCQPDPNCTYGY